MIKCYLHRVIEHEELDDGSILESTELAFDEPLFRLYYEKNITNLMFDYGSDNLNDAGSGIITLTSKNLPEFNNSNNDLSSWTKEELNILKIIEDELNNSEFGCIQFDCY